MVKKIGVLRGREDNFPNALFDIVARKSGGKIIAEPMQIGAERLRKQWDYDLVLDRISHDYPYYRYILKAAAVEGTYVIPNPFQWDADDKLLGFNLADKLGIPVPRTVILPISGSTNLYDITSQSLRNLKWLSPHDWEEIFGYIGFPGWLKPASGGGWLAVSKIRSPDEFWYNLNQAVHHEKSLGFGSEADDLAVRRWLSRTLIFLYQQDIPFDKFARCWYLGGEIMTARFVPPDRVAGQRLGTYENNPDFFGKELLDKIEGYVRLLNESLGYEINTVEFLIKDGVPYAIDFLNFACDMDVRSVGPYFADRCLDIVSDYLIKCVNDPSARMQKNNQLWSKLITGQPL
jgi:hypothetical protein